MEIIINDERRKPIKIKDLECGDTFVLEENGILSDVFMVSDECDEDDNTIILCMNLAKGIIFHTFFGDTIVIPVETKLEARIPQTKES